ncbi:hypothetical protein MJO29_015646 [Puccinia striiformis f. sp. tritici]|nr:hypothetical protein MJO29_015646 [Puccinia striiformis f. sp. tritici]
MRFALVAGALVLGATVTEARSIAPSPSKRSTQTMEFATPTRNLKRARQEDGDWNPTNESEEGPSKDSMDPAAYQSSTPSGGKKNAHKASKHHHKPAASNTDPDPAVRAALPDAVGATLDPVANTVTKKLPEEIQYQIIPVSSTNSSGSQDSPASDAREYIIKPVAPIASQLTAGIDPMDVKQTLDGGIATSDLSGMVNHLKNKEDSKPAIALLRAIENYRQAVSQESQANDTASQSRSTNMKKNGDSKKSLLPSFAQQQISNSPASSLVDPTLVDNTSSQLTNSNPITNSITDPSLTNIIDPNQPSDNDSDAAF